jgi:transposase InsO family protein
MPTKTTTSTSTGFADPFPHTTSERRHGMNARPGGERSLTRRTKWWSPSPVLADVATTAVIERVHANDFGVYGARKVQGLLRRHGRSVARCTIERLMRAAGLRGLSRARGPRTTIAGHGLELRRYLGRSLFTATRPDQLWVVDVTFCRTFAGSVCAAFVIEGYSRRAVGR